MYFLQYKILLLYTYTKNHTLFNQKGYKNMVFIISVSIIYIFYIFECITSIIKYLKTQIFLKDLSNNSYSKY